MKKITFLFALGLLSYCSGPSEKSSAPVESEAEAAAETPSSSIGKRYGVKSGYFVMHNSMFDGLTMTTYFDDFGAKEMVVTTTNFSGAPENEYDIHLDGFSYKFKEGATTGTKMKWYVPATMDYEKISPEDAKRYKYKELGKESILGKECLKFTMEVGNTPVTGWVWKGIAMKTITKAMGAEFTMEVRELQEEPVDAVKFKVPEGVTFTEI